jgi:hypothetical protein
MAYKLNGKTLQADRGFTHNNVQYPRNWLKLSSQGDRDALGITWEDDPVRHDDRYYWNGDVNNPKALEDKEEVDEEGNPLYVQVLDNTDPDNPVMVDTDERLVTKGLKSNMIAQVKDTAGKLLSQTDWYVIRKTERSVDIPTDVASKRTAIVAESERLETAIAGVDSVEALIEVMNSQNWGE